MSFTTHPVPNVPNVMFDSRVTEVTKRLTAAFENLKLLSPTYGIEPDSDFKFSQEAFDEFVRRVCEEHYGKIYCKKGLLKTFRDNVKGDFLLAVISALEQDNSSERLKLLVGELKKVR